MVRFRGALLAVIPLLLATASKVSDVQNNWLAGGLYGVGLVLLGAWAVPGFRQEWEDARAEVRLDRLLDNYNPTTMSISEDGLISGDFTVTGRIWFQRDVVMDDVYVLWKQRRHRWNRCHVVLRATISDTWLQYKLPEHSFRELRLKAGRAISFEQALFADLNVKPLGHVRHGKFSADLYIDLLVPHKTIKVRVTEEISTTAT